MPEQGMVLSWPQGSWRRGPHKYRAVCPPAGCTLQTWAERPGHTCPSPCSCMGARTGQFCLRKERSPGPGKTSIVITLGRACFHSLQTDYFSNQVMNWSTVGRALQTKAPTFSQHWAESQPASFNLIYVPATPRTVRLTTQISCT